METRPLSGFSANTLKGLAMLTMFIDHFAYLVAPNRGPLYAGLHLIGAFTAPILFYFVAEGYRHTRNANRYTLRLALFALLSYVPYIYFFEGGLPNAENFTNLNVIYTLLLGLLAVRVQHEVQRPLPRILLTAVLVLFSAFGDWGYVGVLMILAFDHFYGDEKNQRFAYLLLLLMDFIPLVLTPIQRITYGAAPDFSMYWVALARAGGFVPIFLLRQYNGTIGQGGRLAKWGFYLFYPLHLLALSLIRLYL